MDEKNFARIKARYEKKRQYSIPQALPFDFITENGELRNGRGRPQRLILRLNGDPGLPAQGYEPTPFALFQKLEIAAIARVLLQHLPVKRRRFVRAALLVANDGHIQLHTGMVC